MRVLLAAVLLLALPLAPAATGLAVGDLPLASETVARIADPAMAEAGSTRPLLLPPPMQTQGGGESAPSASEPARGLDLGTDAYGMLLRDLALATGAPDAHEAYAAYGARMGWGAAPPSSPNQFSENSTITYTHDIGDVDRDGVRDLALDVYCTAIQGCPDFTNRYGVPSGTPAPQTTVVSSGAQCQKPHLLLTVSGRDGHELRNRSLDAPHAVPAVLYGGCSVTWVVGTLPLADGTHGVLLYTISMVDIYFAALARIDIQHDLTLLDMKTGEPAWSYQQVGYHYTPTAPALNIPCAHATGNNVLLNPLIQQAPPRGIGAVPTGTPVTFDVQSVGFNYTYCTTWLSDGLVCAAACVLVNDYRPDEWMARLDLATGKELWRADTFLPTEANHSVIPRFLFQAPLAGTYPPVQLDWDVTQVINRHDHYWNARRCCYDLTGDGVNDFAATTLEFSDTPSSNFDGLYGLRSRLVVFDGADGHRISATTLVEDAGAQVLATRLEPLGDADGDGDGDLAVHVVSLLPYYRHILSVRDQDGNEAWRIDNPRDLETLVIGDADGDGGNDLLVVEWTDWEGQGAGGATISTPYTNVTHLPLKVFSGRDGDLVWKRDHFGAVIDIVTILGNLRANGVPDLNGDGVAEVLIDDPTMLPDRTVLHRLAWIDPGTDKAVARFVSVGAFALPAMAGDSDGDGREDLVLLNGDINDLWLTLIDADGDAQWSRRIAAPRLSGYASAVPTLRTHEIDAVGRAGEDLLLNFQLSYTTVGSFIVSASLSQQITGLRGGNGTLVWSAPAHHDANSTEGTLGASPASALFAAALARDAAAGQAQLASVAGLAAPGAIVAGIAAAAGFFLVRRLRL